MKMWVLAGATAVLLTGAAVNIELRNVEADALLPLSRPAATLPPTASTAAKLAAADVKTVRVEQKKSMLRGLASWYGDTFDGQRTANGETFDQTAMTACHKTLPFGSLVKVVNLRNGRSVIVRITDRGTLAAGRVIDLSRGAAQQLAMTDAGLAPVVLQVLMRGNGAYHSQPAATAPAADAAKQDAPKPDATKPDATPAPAN